jgi:hypothetical protein
MMTQNHQPEETQMKPRQIILNMGDVPNVSDVLSVSANLVGGAVTVLATRTAGTACRKFSSLEHSMGTKR